MNPAYGVLLRQAVYEHRSHYSRWLSWAMLLGGLLLLLGFGLIKGDWRLGLLLLDILAGSLALLWWGILLRISVVQNTPANACLVPQLRRRLMLVLIVVYGAVVLLMALLAAVAFGHFGYVLAGLALMFPFTLLVQRYSWLSFMPSVIIFAALSVPKEPLHALAGFMGAQDEALLSLLMLLAIVLLSEWALTQAFPRGGDAHAEWHRQYVFKLEQLRGNVRNDFANGVAWRWPRALTAWRMLGLGRRLRPGSSPEQLTQYALGASLFSRAASVPLTAALGWLVAGLSGLMADPAQPAMRVGSGLIELLALMSLPIGLQWLASAIAARSAELGLLRLAPAMVAGDRVNAMLARLCLQAFALMWMAVCLCVLAAERLGTGSWAVTGQMLLLFALPLPFCGIVLRDYAAMPVQRTPANTGLLLMVLASTTATALRWNLPSICGYVAIAIAAAGLWNACVRWRAMLRAPVAFPSGRLA